MQNQMTSRIVLPLASRIAGVYTTEVYPKSDMNKVAFQLDFAAGAANGTTFSVTVLASLDGTMYHAIGSATTGTLSASVRGCVVDAVTAAPNVKLQVTTGVNTASCSVMAIGSM
jgi:hypothetical protein